MCTRRNCALEQTKTFSLFKQHPAKSKNPQNNTVRCPSKAHRILGRELIRSRMTRPFTCRLTQSNTKHNSFFFFLNSSHSRTWTFKDTEKILLHSQQSKRPRRSLWSPSTCVRPPEIPQHLKLANVRWHNFLFLLFYCFQIFQPTIS